MATSWLSVLQRFSSSADVHKATPSASGGKDKVRDQAAGRATEFEQRKERAVSSLCVSSEL